MLKQKPCATRTKVCLKLAVIHIEPEMTQARHLEVVKKQATNSLNALRVTAQSCNRSKTVTIHH